MPGAALIFKRLFHRAFLQAIRRAAETGATFTEHLRRQEVDSLQRNRCSEWRGAQRSVPACARMI